MTIIRIKSKETEFNTDDFTATQWENFISDNIPFYILEKELKSPELFKFEKLKALALKFYAINGELEKEFKSWRK